MSFKVQNDGIYQYSEGPFPRLVIPKDIFDEALEKWYGFVPKCKHYTKDGYCLNTAQHWQVSCNGCKGFCDNGNW